MVRSSKKYKGYASCHDHYASMTHAKILQKMRQFDMDLGRFDAIKALGDNSTVLDLGCGMGIFAHFCHRHGVRKYTGVDLDKTALLPSQKRYPQYEFFAQDILKFVRSCRKKFDLIFISHTLEHLSVEDTQKILSAVSDLLSPGGTFINIMPNGESIFLLGHLRYGDVTHSQLYTARSFNQLLLEHFSRDAISHYNNRLTRNPIARFVHRCSLLLFSFWISTLGFRRPRIYTQEIITIVKNV